MNLIGGIITTVIIDSGYPLSYPESIKNIMSITKYLQFGVRKLVFAPSLYHLALYYSVFFHIALWYGHLRKVAFMKKSTKRDRAKSRWFDDFPTILIRL